MRGVPRPRRLVVAQASAVVVADHRSAFSTARPVAARHVLVSRQRTAVRCGAGQYVVHVDGIAYARNYTAFLADRVLFAEVIAAVELVHVARDDDTFHVLPWAPAN